MDGAVLGHWGDPGVGAQVTAGDLVFPVIHNDLVLLPYSLLESPLSPRWTLVWTSCLCCVLPLFSLMRRVTEVTASVSLNTSRNAFSDICGGIDSTLDFGWSKTYWNFLNEYERKKNYLKKKSSRKLENNPKSMLDGNILGGWVFGHTSFQTWSEH